ncbi:MAG: glycosyl transferase family 1, partial [Proteobacteria bacterium]|nr:glycosyl transferase family 1 [Pseudomonadota bacterium]
MHFVFIHPNFPAQFRSLAEFLGKNPKNQVMFITANPREEWEIVGVKKIIFQEEELPEDISSPPLKNFTALHSKAAAVARVLFDLRKQQFMPDLIIGHSGWGSTFYIKD